MAEDTWWTSVTGIATINKNSEVPFSYLFSSNDKSSKLSQALRVRWLKVLCFMLHNCVLDYGLISYCFPYFCFQESELFQCGESNTCPDEKNSNKPSLTEAIFTILSYCTLSPTSLGVVLENFLEKEKMWDCLYNMSGIRNMVKCTCVYIVLVFFNQYKFWWSQVCLYIVSIIEKRKNWCFNQVSRTRAKSATGWNVFVYMSAVQMVGC